MRLERTIGDAKRFIHKRFHDGVECPCCEQFVKLYRRKLNSSMFRTLVLLHLEQEKTGSWVHIRKLLAKNKISQGTDSALLVHWGLIKERPKNPDDSARKTSGYWKVTKKGRLFLGGKIKVPSKIFVYNSRLHGLSSDLVAAHDCAGENFNYKELMEL